MSLEQKRNNVTSLEDQILDQIQTFFVISKELSKKIEELKTAGQDVSALETTHQNLVRDLEKLSDELDALDIGKS